MWRLVKTSLVLSGILAAFFVLSLVARLWIEHRIPPDGQIIVIDGVNLHYVDRGAGRPIVLIHGLSGQLRNFAPELVDRLAAEHRVVLIDRPGSGYSGPLSGGANTLAAQANIVAGLITALDLDPPLIVGHSLGGALALNLALDHPDLVGALALVAPATQPGEIVPSAFRSMVMPSDALQRFVSLTFAAPFGVLVFDRTAKRVFAPDMMPPDFSTNGGGLLAVRPENFFAIGSDLSALKDALPAMAARYASLRLPVGILYGQSDPILDPTIHGARLRDAVPGASLTQIAGGHMIVYTQPEKVADWILAQDLQNAQTGQSND